jgi:hypothetical protein
MRRKASRTKDGAAFRVTWLGRLAVTAVWIGLLAKVAGAQDLPSAPVKTATPAVRSRGAYDYLFRAGVVCGGGASRSVAETKPTAQCGVIFSMLLFDFEIGGMGPMATPKGASGYFSTSFVVPLVAWSRWGNPRGAPLVVGGYTHMFETENALDYGVAFERPIDQGHSVQFEVRDYWAYSEAGRRDVVFRIAFLDGIPD